MRSCLVSGLGGSEIVWMVWGEELDTCVKDLNCGIEIDTGELSILLYADDIVLMAPSVKNLQKMLNFVAEWCQK